MQPKVFLLSIAAVALFWTTSASAADTHQGKVVETSAGKLTMTDMTGKNQHTHDISSEATVSRAGKTAALTDLKAGDSVTITMEKKGEKPAVTKVEALPASSS
jgi:Cu/Ag efflux protein CusF